MKDIILRLDSVCYLAVPCADVVSGGLGGVLPYMGHLGMCRCERYGFQAVYSSICNRADN